MKNLVAPMMLPMMLVALAGCTAMAGTWPDRANKSPVQMLVDVVRWQQHAEVRASYGELAHECFTDEDYAAFERGKRPQIIVERLKKAADFQEIASALRALLPEERAQVFKVARAIARPTWAMMGRIDRTGQGQTEAGRRAELLIAAAIVDAFAGAVGGK